MKVVELFVVTLAFTSVACQPEANLSEAEAVDAVGSIVLVSGGVASSGACSIASDSSNPWGGSGAPIIPLGECPAASQIDSVQWWVVQRPCPFPYNAPGYVTTCLQHRGFVIRVCTKDGQCKYIIANDLTGRGDVGIVTGETGGTIVSQGTIPPANWPAACTGLQEAASSCAADPEGGYNPLAHICGGGNNCRTESVKLENAVTQQSICTNYSGSTAECCMSCFNAGFSGFESYENPLWWDSCTCT